MIIPFNSNRNRSSEQSWDPEFTQRVRQTGFESGFWAPAAKLISWPGAASQAKTGAASPQPQMHWEVSGSWSSPRWRLKPSLPLPFILGHFHSPGSLFLSHPDCVYHPRPGAMTVRTQERDKASVKQSHAMGWTVPHKAQEEGHPASWAPAQPSPRLERRSLWALLGTPRDPPSRGWLLPSLVHIQRLHKVTDKSVDFCPHGSEVASISQLYPAHTLWAADRPQHLASIPFTWTKVSHHNPTPQSWGYTHTHSYTLWDCQPAILRAWDTFPITWLETLRPRKAKSQPEKAPGGALCLQDKDTLGLEGWTAQTYVLFGLYCVA